MTEPTAEDLRAAKEIVVGIYGEDVQDSDAQLYAAIARAIAGEREKAQGDGTAIIVAVLGLTQADENFRVSWDHSTKMWRFESSWLDIDINNRSLRPLLEEGLAAIRAGGKQ